MPQPTTTDDNDDGGDLLDRLTVARMLGTSPAQVTQWARLGRLRGVIPSNPGGQGGVRAGRAAGVYSPEPRSRLSGVVVPPIRGTRPVPDDEPPRCVVSATSHDSRRRCVNWGTRSPGGRPPRSWAT